MKVTNLKLRRIIREALEDLESTPDMMADEDQRFSTIVDIARQAVRDLDREQLTGHTTGQRILGENLLALSKEFRLLADETEQAWHNGDQVFGYVDMLRKLASIKG